MLIYNLNEVLYAKAKANVLHFNAQIYIQYTYIYLDIFNGN